MNNDQLKKQIKEKVGLVDIDSVLDHYSQFRVDVSTAKTNINSELEAILNDLDENGVEIHRKIFERTQDLDPVGSAKVLDKISYSLTTISDLPPESKSDILPVLERTDSFDNGDFQNYWHDFFSIFDGSNYERAIHHCVIANLATFSPAELEVLNSKCIQDSNTQMELDYRYEFRRVLGKEEFTDDDKEELLLKAEHGIVLGEFISEFKLEYPEISAFDPEFKLIHSVSDLFKSNSELKRIFDFEGIGHLSKEEYRRYVKLTVAVNDSLKTREIVDQSNELQEIMESLRTEKTRVERLSESIETVVNVAFGGGFFTDEDFSERELGDDFFEFYQNLLKSVDDESKKYVADSTFITVNALPLYSLDKMGLMQSDRIQQLKEGLGVDPDEESLFYSRLADLSYIFSFGTDVNKRLFWLYSSLALHEPEERKSYLDSLKNLKHQRGANHSQRLDYLAKISRIKREDQFEPIPQRIVTGLAKAIASDKGLEELLMATQDETYQVLENLFGSKEPVRDQLVAFKSFIKSTKQFHGLLKNSCEPAEIEEEYREWLQDSLEKKNS